MDCDQEYGVAGTGESSTSDRDIAVDRSIVIELLGLFGVDKEPLEIRKIIGMSIALIGVAIFQWK